MQSMTQPQHDQQRSPCDPVKPKTANSRRTRVGLVLAVSAFITACAAPAPQASQQPVPQPPAQQDSCNATGAQFAVGQSFNTPLAEEARQRAGADTVRALRPNQAVTMEFNGRRLNLDIDAAGTVTRVRCG